MTFCYHFRDLHDLAGFGLCRKRYMLPLPVIMLMITDKRGSRICWRS